MNKSAVSEEAALKAKLEDYKSRRDDDLGQPPSKTERLDNVAEPELRPKRRKNDEEVQYNIRVPRWLKHDLQDLVRDERQALAEILPKMLELYRQHRKRRKEHATLGDEGDKT